MRRLMPFGFALLALFLAAPLAPAAASDATLWRDWDAGLRVAGSLGRPVLVDVYTDWCGWCRRMDRDVYARQDVRDYLTGHFVTVKLNAESSDGARYEGRSFSGRTLAARFRVTGYPTTIFLKPGGDHIFNVPGYVPADQFLLLLRYIGDGHQARGVPWDDYLSRATGGAGDGR